MLNQFKSLRTKNGKHRSNFISLCKNKINNYLIINFPKYILISCSGIARVQLDAKILFIAGSCIQLNSSNTTPILARP